MRSTPPSRGRTRCTLPGVALLGRMLGNFDLSKYPLDGPLPDLPLTDSGQQSRQRLLTELAGRENLTLAELGRRIAGGRGHYSLVGTPSGTNFNDLNLTNGTPYYYVVSAVNPAGEGGDDSNCPGLQETETTKPGKLKLRPLTARYHKFALPSPG